MSPTLPAETAADAVHPADPSTAGASTASPTDAELEALLDPAPAAGAEGSAASAGLVHERTAFEESPPATAAGSKDATDAAAPPTVVVKAEPVEHLIQAFRSALDELVKRPAPALDLAPLVQTVQAEIEHTTAQQKVATEAVAAVVNELRDFGRRVEKSESTTLQALASLQEHLVTSDRPAPAYLVQRRSRSPGLVLAIVFLMVCWAGVFWLKTGNPKLAIGMLVGANAVGCLLLATRR